mmetsp:Transcript_12763/g.28030  ORF Transcript_12763/g.28030 Transcript_12763/m.28030 type:complete len:279 (-) Transcript_12763:51-887(-)
MMLLYYHTTRVVLLWLLFHTFQRSGVPILPPIWPSSIKNVRDQSIPCISVPSSIFHTKYSISLFFLRRLGLEVGEHGARVGHFKRIGATVLGNAAAFDKQLFDHHVVNDGRVPPRTFSKTTFLFPNARHAHSASKQGGTVGHQLDLGESGSSNGHVFGEALLESPLTHDKGIIDRKAHDFVDTQRLDFFISGFVSGQMGRGAGRSKGSRQGENGDALALEIIFRRDVLPIKGVFVLGATNADASLEGHRRNGGSFFDGSGPFGLGRLRIGHGCGVVVV